MVLKTSGKKKRMTVQFFFKMRRRDTGGGLILGRPWRPCLRLTQSLSPSAFWLLSSWGTSHHWTRMRPPGHFAWGGLLRRTAWLRDQWLPDGAGCCDGPSGPVLATCPWLFAVIWDPGRLGSEQWPLQLSPRCRSLGCCSLLC